MSKTNSLYKKSQILLNCSWLLYLVFFLAAADLYIFAVNGELFFVSLFVLIGYLTTFFSKNMTVILLVAMTLTNILRFGKDVRIHEGMESGAEANGTTSAGSTTIQVGKEGGSEGEGGDYQFLDKDTDKEKPDKKDATTKKTPIIENVVSGAPVSSPAASPVSASEAPLLTDKIAGLDQDTVNLLQKQHKLMESMRNLEPMLAKAETFLGDLNKQK